MFYNFITKYTEFFCWKNERSCKSFSHFLNKKYWHIWDINVWNLNETSTNNVFSFEQPGPEVYKTGKKYSVNPQRTHKGTGMHCYLPALMHQTRLKTAPHLGMQQILRQTHLLYYLDAVWRTQIILTLSLSIVGSWASCQVLPLSFDIFSCRKPSYNILSKKYCIYLAIRPGFPFSTITTSK